jgi:hypothetical protein
MNSKRLDEETPLLADQRDKANKKTPSPIPWGQFTVLLILQLAEPLNSLVIYPFAPQVCMRVIQSMMQLAHLLYCSSFGMWVSPMGTRHR